MKKSPHTGIFLLVLIQLLLAINIYTDYGWHWDDYSTRVIGTNNALLANQRLNYLIISEDKLEKLVADKLKVRDKNTYLSLDSLENYELSQYGAFFELGLMAVEWGLGLKSHYDIFYTRHLMVHLFFLVALIFFYFLLFYQFKDWKISLLGVMFLLLCPRIFAHSFFNTKDIPFLSACILATFSFFNLAKNPNYKYALLHALFCAIAIDIRIIGLIFPALTIGLYLNLAYAEKKWILYLKQGTFFSIICLLLIIAFWPYLWKDPFGHLLFTLQSMSKYPWGGSLIFQGDIFQPQYYLPWYYFPIWFTISIPVFYFMAFLLSFWKLWKVDLKEVFTPGSQLQLQLFALLLLFSPWFVAIIRKSVLLDGWRHFYFVYPFFVILMIAGLEKLKTHFLIPEKWFYSGLAIPLIWVAISMIQLHPHQYIYTNVLVKKPLAGKFELDYWGLSYKKGLEFLIDYQESGQIKLAIAEEPGETNLLALSPEEQVRIQLIDLSEADYFMSTFREVLDRASYLKEKGVKPDQEIFSVEIGGDIILSLYKMN